MYIGLRPWAAFQGGTTHRAEPGGWRKRSFLIETPTACRLSYQGTWLRSCACGDCSGRPPAITSSAMSRTPAHPPPANAATNHQNETICLPPFRRSRELPGTEAAPWLRCSKKNPACAGPAVRMTDRCLLLNWPFGKRHREPRHGIRVVARGPVPQRLEPYGLRTLKKSGLGRVFGWPRNSLPNLALNAARLRDSCQPRDERFCRV